MKLSNPQHAENSAYKDLVAQSARPADLEKLHAFGLPPGTLINAFGGIFTQFGGPQLVSALIPALVKLIGSIGQPATTPLPTEPTVPGVKTP